MMYDAVVYRLGAVETGHISSWQDYEIEKRKRVRKDGTQKTYYEIIIDGDNEGVELTLKQARQYIKDLRDSWIENHPGEIAAF